MKKNGSKPRLAVHKFTSCDGCQLAFLNAGETLITLSGLVDIVHFVEEGPIDPETKVDIAFVEGSISTPEEEARIKKIRANSQYIITIGACATAGGIQALRNFVNHQEWLQSVYASPEYIKTLSTSTAISNHVKVDCELWGCPVNTHQVISTVRALLFQVKPQIKQDAVCMECKRRNNVCVLVAKGEPCMGPVTQTGCDSLCPNITRLCYACYGPKENPNTDSLGMWFEKKLGLKAAEVARGFLHINNQAKAFKTAGQYFKNIKIITDSGNQE